MEYLGALRRKEVKDIDKQDSSKKQVKVSYHETTSKQTLS